MLGKEILTIGVVSILLSNTLLFAEGNACQGNCFAILDQPRNEVSDIKKIDEHDRSFIHLLDADPFTDLSNTLLFAEGNACQGNCFAILDQPRNQVLVVKKIDEHDRSFIQLLDADPFTDLPPHKIMEEEVIDETFDEELVVTEVIVSTSEKIEDVILDKSLLKDSLYYCENEKKAQFNEFDESYQCV